MNKTFLIFKHEFIHTISRKGFITMAILFPLIGLAAIGIFQLTQIVGKPSETVDDTPRIGYIDEAGGFTDYEGDFGRIMLVPFSERDGATEAMLAGDIEEYFIIPTEYLNNGIVRRYHTEKELEMCHKTNVKESEVCHECHSRIEF